MKNILFRADSSSTIGTGHIMRDLILASHYKESKIIFATQELDGNSNQKIKEADYKIELLKSNGVKEVIKLVKKYNIDLIVIDHYDINYKYEKELKKTTGVKILSFDDTYEKHCCDILLKHNISADKKRYLDLLPQSCELRCGTEFTLLRDEFIREKKKNYNLKSDGEKTIFLAMGGADHGNLNIEILKVLEKFNNIRVNLATTTANENLKELKKYVKNREWINIHINSKTIAKFIRKSNFAIITPSVSANEVYFMGTPFIAIKTAENQDDIYRYLKKKKFSVLERFNNKELKKHVEVLLSKDDKDA